MGTKADYKKIKFSFRISKKKRKRKRKKVVYEKVDNLLPFSLQFFSARKLVVVK